MKTEKTGWLSKIINALSFKLPWHSYVALLIGATIIGALLLSIPVGIIGDFGSVVALFAIMYAIIALVLRLVMKASGSEKLYPDLVYTLFYERSYRLLVAISIGSIILFSFALTFLPNLGKSIYSRDFLDMFCYIFLAGLLMFLVVLSYYGIFAIPIKFILRCIGWCPSCGKFFALKTTSREVVDTQEISVKETVNRRNSRGEVIGQDEQYIPGTREVVEKVKTCKYCGSTLTSVKARDYANL